MALWITLALLAQGINAAVALVDKYIVTSEKIPARPFVYAFYTCIFAGLWVLIFLAGSIPLFQSFAVPTLANVAPPSFTIAALSLLSAYTFFIALVSLYSALKEGDTSDVIPVVGAMSAVTAFLLGYVFLGTTLTPNFIIGLALLSTGMILVSRLRFRLSTALTSIHAGLFFGVHYVVIKGLFDETSFDNGFFWSRVAFFAVALSMLLVPGYLEKIRTQTKGVDRQGGLLVLGNKLLAGVGSILILKATAMGSVALVQALGAFQFIFIFIFSVFFGKNGPVECRESLTCNEDIYHKAIIIAVITVGFFVLFL